MDKPQEENLERNTTVLWNLLADERVGLIVTVLKLTQKTHKRAQCNCVHPDHGDGYALLDERDARPHNESCPTCGKPCPDLFSKWEFWGYYNFTCEGDGTRSIKGKPNTQPSTTQTPPCNVSTTPSLGIPTHIPG
ncbi:hypothetical protein PAMP_003480 [Pampus punctatissimus]